MARKNDKKKRPQKQVDLRGIGLYSAEQILDDFIYIYHIDKKNKELDKLKKYFSELISHGEYSHVRPKGYKIKGNVFYYSSDEKEKIMRDPKIVRYFEKIGKIPKSYKTDYEIQKHLQQDIASAKLIPETYRKAAKLSDENVIFINYVNNAHGYHYLLTPEELYILGKTGIVKYRDLDEKDQRVLEEHHVRDMNFSEYLEKYEQFFQRMKFEIMLTALFEDRFEFEEDLLKEDIRNFFLISDMDLSGFTDDMRDHPNTKLYKRSMDRLLYSKKNYYRRKKSNK